MRNEGKGKRPEAVFNLLRVVALGCMAAIALVLIACGQGGSSSSSAATAASASSEESAAAGASQGAKTRDFSELESKADKAVEEALVLAGKESDKEQKSKATAEFENGNTRYRARDYSQADARYREALSYDPKNYGANVNLTLALLQEKNNEDALGQALKCVALFPDDAGCLLNAQVAATACNFGAEDIDKVLERIVSECGGVTVAEVLTSASSATGSDPEKWNQAYLYNMLWNQIEVALSGDEQAVRDAYEGMQASFNWLVQEGHDDDAAALQAYLEAAAQKRGLT